MTCWTPGMSSPRAAMSVANSRPLPLPASNTDINPFTSYICFTCQTANSTTLSAWEVSSQQLWSAGFFCGRPAIWNWLPDSMRDPATSRDSFRRFYFQLTCVHSALELSGWYDLQIYLLTYLTVLSACPTIVNRVSTGIKTNFLFSKTSRS